jgi:hypothetical protein
LIRSITNSPAERRGRFSLHGFEGRLRCDLPGDVTPISFLQARSMLRPYAKILESGELDVPAKVKDLRSEDLSYINAGAACCALAEKFSKTVGQMFQRTSKTSGLKT